MEEEENRKLDRESVERLKRAETLEDVKEGLNISQYIWNGNTEDLEVYGEYLGVVVEKIFGSTGYWECLAPEERRKLIDNVLGSPVNGDATLVCLERAAAEGTEGVMRAVEHYFVEKTGIGATFCTLCIRMDCDADSAKKRWTSAVGAVCGLPWVLSNMYQGKISRGLRPEHFIGNAVRQCMQGLWTLDNKARLQGTSFIGILLGKAERVGLSNIVARIIVECLVLHSKKEENNTDTNDIKRIMRAIGTGSGGNEGLLRMFLDEVECAKVDKMRKEAWAREAVAGRVEGGGETAKRTIVGRFICVKGREETLETLIAALSSLNLLRDAVKNAVNSWRETFFISHASPDLDSCKNNNNFLLPLFYPENKFIIIFLIDITSGICLMLKQMKREEISAWGLLGPLLRGVQSHMSSPIERTRNFGIVKKLSKIKNIIMYTL